MKKTFKLVKKRNFPKRIKYNMKNINSKKRKKVKKQKVRNKL